MQGKRCASRRRAHRLRTSAAHTGLANRLASRRKPVCGLVSAVGIRAVAVYVLRLAVAEVTRRQTAHHHHDRSCPPAGNGDQHEVIVRVARQGETHRPAVVGVRALERGWSWAGVLVPLVMSQGALERSRAPGAARRGETGRRGASPGRLIRMSGQPLRITLAGGCRVATFGGAGDVDAMAARIERFLSEELASTGTRVAGSRRGAE